MMRSAVRAMALTFSVFALLLGGILISAGAFRPMRFLTAHLSSTTPYEINLRAFAPNGSHVPFITSVSGIVWDGSYDNRITWAPFEDPMDLHVWENGDQTIIENTTPNILWSSNGMAVWWFNTPENNLRIWDGEQVHPFTTSAQNLIGIDWTAENQLWWVQKSWNGTWELMLWDNHEITTLYSSDQDILRVQFFDCGAIGLDRLDNSYDLYRLRDKALLAFPEDLWIIESFWTDTCESFAGMVPGELTGWFWNGGTHTHLPFQIYGIQGENNILGVNWTTIPDGWTLVYQHGDQSQEQVVETIYPQLLGWETSTSFWALPQRDDTGSLMLWFMDEERTEHYPIAPFTESSFRLDPARQRAVWIATIELNVIELSLWDNTTRSRRSLQLSENSAPVQYRDIRWMNDGNLLITLFPNISSQPDLPGSLYIYHWEEDRLERIGALPAGTTGFSDWMTWE